MRNFLVALAVFLIVVVGLGTIVVRIFNRNPDPPPTTGQTTQQAKFPDKTTKVRFTTDGAIVGLENHRAIRITIDQAERKLEVLKGYNEESIRTISLPNDSAAYKELLNTLNGLGYTKENPKVSKDDQGACPLGQRFIYEATYETGVPLRSWSSSCSSIARLQGNASTIQQVFRNQIPDYKKLVADVNLTKP